MKFDAECTRAMQSTLHIEHNAGMAELTHEPQHAPRHTFYLCPSDIPAICRMLMDIACKARGKTHPQRMYKGVVVSHDPVDGWSCDLTATNFKTLSQVKEYITDWSQNENISHE